MKIMPVEYSPDCLLMDRVEKLSYSESKWVSQGLTRVVSLIVYSPACIASIFYNAIALIIKTPISLVRYTFGYIPTSNGKFADKLPCNTQLKYLAYHAYKVFMFWFDIYLFPLAVIHPKANYYAHKSVALITTKQPLDQKKQMGDKSEPKPGRAPQAPAAPPAPQAPAVPKVPSTGKRKGKSAVLEEMKNLDPKKSLKKVSENPDEDRSRRQPKETRGMHGVSLKDILARRKRLKATGKNNIGNNPKS